jgi:multiple sugar transport system permease protein
MLQKLAGYLIVTICVVPFVLPFYWMVTTALKDAGQVYAMPPVWWPKPLKFQNFIDAWNMAPFATFFKNTIIITGSCVMGTVLTSSLVAYGFARIPFPGRDQLFVILLATMMVPSQVTMVPLYLIFRRLGWIDTFKPLIVPSFFGGSAYYIFLMRQFFLSLPVSLEEAAYIDGCSSFGIFTRIFLPLSKPALTTVAIFSFLHHWNEFFGPLIYLNREARYTLAIGLRYFLYEQGGYFNLLMAASTMTMLPCLVLFIFCQRYFIEGVVMTGVRG